MMKRTDMLIKVPESEFKPLIDRERSLADVKEHMGPWIDLIRDVVNYGSNLIPRCFSSSKRNWADLVVIAILLRQVVAMLDGAEVLLSAGAVHAAILQMRALFEASVYIEWILKGDPEKRAIYYYAHNLRRKRHWAMITQSGSPESNDFAETMNESIVKMTVPIRDELKESAKKQIEDIDRVLSQSKFVEVNKEFEQFSKQKKHDVAWYVPLGKKSFRAIAREVGMGSMYELFYSSASGVMHTSSYDQHVKFGMGEVTFQPIRHLEDFQQVLHFSVSMAQHAYRRVLEVYRNGELPAFSKKYMEKWRRESINFLKIEYEAGGTTTI